MKKRRKWYGLKIIVPALLILPPLGLYLLWRSPRSNRVKVFVTVVLILLVGVGRVAYVKSGIYEKWAEPPIPESGFDVTRDSRGGYEIERILPLERKVFNDAVKEMRRTSKDPSWTSLQGVSIYTADPESRAFSIIAKRYGLDTSEVELIYMKVSSRLARER